MLPVLKIDDYGQGNTLKQGDKTKLSYGLYATDRRDLGIAGRTGEVVFLRGVDEYYRGPVTVDTNDNAIFTVGETLPAGAYHVEFIIGDMVFPSDYKHYFTITPSSLGSDVSVIAKYGIDEIVRRVAEIIGTGATGGDGQIIDTTQFALKSDLVNYVRTNTLSSYALSNHNHDGVYAPVAHNHDGRYALKTHSHTEYAPINHTHTEYATKEDLANVSTGGTVDLTGYVKTTDLASYAKSTDLNSYAKLTDIPKDYLTSIPSEYVTETELANKGYITLAQVPSESFTKVQADLLYQPKGDYATKSDLTNAQIGSGQEVDLTNYVTKVEMDNAIQSIPIPSLVDYALKSEIPDTSQFITLQDLPADKDTVYDDTVISGRVSNLESQLGDVETALATIIGGA